MTGSTVLLRFSDPVQGNAIVAANFSRSVGGSTSLSLNFSSSPASSVSSSYTNLVLSGGGDPGSGSDEIRFSCTTANQILTLEAGTSGIERVVIGTGTGTSASTTGTPGSASAAAMASTPSPVVAAPTASC